MEALVELGITPNEAREILCNASVGIRSRMATVAKAYANEDMGTHMYLEKTEALSLQRDLVESLLRRLSEEENSLAHQSLMASMTPEQQRDYEAKKGFI